MLLIFHCKFKSLSPDLHKEYVLDFKEKNGDYVDI